jgi:small-conductance mechanosensitive channel
MLIVCVQLCLGLYIDWGGSFYEINVWVREIQNGLVFLSATFYPEKIIQAVSQFCVLLLVGRFFATYVSNLPRFSNDKHRQVTINLILRYIVFGVAIVNALFVSGVNFKGLALITGALSFGLGFGLQHFLSDFVSGLFILMNRPMKIGDHIVVDGEEGFIKKIALFSTQISTLEQADVIIPNSYLITKSLKNFTFENNKYYAIKISIQPPDGANLILCQHLLLEVATKNTHVVHSATIYPVVLFDKNLLTLCCTIMNVNKKDIVISELCYAITQLFEEHTMPVRIL